MKRMVGVPGRVCLFLLILALCSCQTAPQKGPSSSAVQPMDPKAHFDRGTLLSQNGEQDKAIEAFSKALEMDPGYVFAYLRRGLAYYFKGEDDRAMADYEKALEIDSKALDLCTYRALTYERRGQYDLAIADYEKVMKTDPKGSGVIHHSLGRIHRLRGQYEEAVSEYTKALEIGPELPMTHLQRGMAYSEMKRYDEAIADFDREIRLSPEDPYAFVERGKASLGKKDFDKALLDFGKAIEKDKRTGEAYFGRAQVYRLKEDYDRSWREAHLAVRAGFHIPPQFMTDLRKASLKHEFGQTNQPLSEEQLAAVSRAEVMGRAVYDQDIVAARGTDALSAKVDLRKEGEKGLVSWITVKKEAGWLVRFYAKRGEDCLAAYDISFWSPKGPIVYRRDPPEKLSESENQMVRAREKAASAMPFRCSNRYNPVVLPGAMDGFDGWLVYLLASTTETDKMVVGGHFRVEVSKDGRTVRKVDPLSKNCLTLDLAEARRKDASRLVVTQILTDTPMEHHVLASLLNKTPLTVVAKTGVWSVSNGLIRYLSSLAKDEKKP